eukprot:RCo033184
MIPRLHLFEIHDLPQCPQFLRHCITANLAAVWRFTQNFAVVTPLLESLLRKTGSQVIVDLCAGSGGPLPAIQRRLARRGLSIKAILTDLVPDPAAYERYRTSQPRGGPAVELEYLPVPVDATKCTVEGLRTIFAAFHHFPEPLARQILQNAVRTGSPIAIFECTERSLVNLMFLPIGSFFMAIALAPFVRPFSWARLGLTWLVPVVPMVLAFDTVVSILRTYSPGEMRAIARSVEGSEQFEWEMGTVRWLGLLGVVYYIGYPKNTAGPK